MFMEIVPHPSENGSALLLGSRGGLGLRRGDVRTRQGHCHLVG